MIASLTGTVRQLRINGLVLEVAGVGYLIYATPPTLATLRVSAQATLATSLVVREDALTLYGFTEEDEREVFEIVQTVSGIGPRLALAMLAVHTSDSVRLAIVNSDVKALTRVPGIGPKVAQRLLLELSGKISAPAVNSAAPGAAAPAAADQRGQVIDALVSLGWNVKAAEQALEQVLQDTDQSHVEMTAVPETLRSALKVLGGQRG